MNNKILFVTEKWVDGKQEMGLTNNYHNLFGSLKHCGLGVPFNVVHMDEAMVHHNTNIDKILPKVCHRLKPNIIMFSLLGKSDVNPTIETFQWLKKHHFKVCVHWPDVGIDWGYPQVLQLTKDLVDLHVGWDNADSEYHRTRPLPDNFIQLWVPQDPKLYFKGVHQDIPVSFIGSPRYPDRQMYLNHAINVNKLPILVRGGQREEKLSPELYAQLIRRSKIGINFSGSPGSFEQCKGRVFEILASNSMLLEPKNGATSKLFKSGYDYVDFENADDFVIKTKYFLEHEDERKKIVEQGYKTFTEKYTAKHFWEKILERLK